jgi:hypothetical protein
LIPVTREMYRITYRAIGIDVADICSHARCATDIVEAERGHQRVDFEEQGERLADASTRAEHSDFGLPCGGCGKGTSLRG